MLHNKILIIKINTNYQKRYKYFSITHIINSNKIVKTNFTINIFRTIYTAL